MPFAPVEMLVFGLHVPEVTVSFGNAGPSVPKTRQDSLVRIQQRVNMLHMLLLVTDPRAQSRFAKLVSLAVAFPSSRRPNSSFCPSSVAPTDFVHRKEANP